MAMKISQFRLRLFTKVEKKGNFSVVSGKDLRLSPKRFSPPLLLPNVGIETTAVWNKNKGEDEMDERRRIRWVIAISPGQIFWWFYIVVFASAAAGFSLLHWLLEPFIRNQELLLDITFFGALAVAVASARWTWSFFERNYF